MSFCFNIHSSKTSLDKNEINCLYKRMKLFSLQQDFKPDNNKKLSVLFHYKVNWQLTIINNDVNDVRLIYNKKEHCLRQKTL